MRLAQTQVVDVAKELFKLPLLGDILPELIDRYSERREAAAELAKRMNQNKL